MATYFTPRQRRLMGLPEPEPVAPVPSALPPRCCAAAVAERCTCEAMRWRCRTHGLTGQPCTTLSHD